MAANGTDKGPDAFRTISEVAEDLELPQHVLRFWETRFAAIRPLKRGGGRRYYRPDDIDLLKGIRHLLYGEGYTIKGVQRILKEEGVRFVQAIGRGEQVAAIPQPTAMDADESEPDDEGHAPANIPDRTVAHPSSASRYEADWARLRAALDDLQECERVLSTLRVVPEPGGGE
jgi:DNA-binding transcriptional MerR regulator